MIGENDGRVGQDILYFAGRPLSGVQGQGDGARGRVCAG